MGLQSELEGHSMVYAETKILEKIIKGSIGSRLTEGNFLSAGQHDFVAGSSCLTNFVTFYDQVMHCLDKGDEVDVIYLDFKKAFDFISHDVFMAKLENCSHDRSTLSCRAGFQRGSFQLNTQLKNLVEKIKEQSLKPGKEQMVNQCVEHEEKLKLFCEEDGEAICVICRESQAHHGQKVLPIQEAANNYKNTVKQQRERIKSECEKLRCFVSEEEQRLLQRLEEEERETLQSLEENVAQLSKQSSSLHKLISEIEEKSLQTPAELLKDVRRTLDRSKDVKLQEAKAVSTELKTLCSIPGIVEMLRKCL
ncbi:E3 ubiquitin-protein ligase TRIM17-like [Alligator sinensis]|uniref:E3 ubiquitin-protein ligase TRIM17-like n=1 Tax=Alligator sinensis TaxID=38654 RepID=A0A3Q0HA60_ALLSI|nr:E3 ubiquitin-protein ligase TRIM17-like [Alligator sinensis]